MTTKTDGGSAFPVWELNGHGQQEMTEFGMSMRDAFAIAALQGLCANPGGPIQQSPRTGWGLVNCTLEHIAEEAYLLADAMLAARVQP